jgi:hypothetical protein
MSDNSPLIQPTLQHFGVLTGHLERMVDWYAKVVGMTTRYSTSREVGASVTFLSNDKSSVISNAVIPSSKCFVQIF